jgi:hypothetical protein
MAEEGAVAYASRAARAVRTSLSAGEPHGCWRRPCVSTVVGISWSRPYVEGVLVDHTGRLAPRSVGESVGYLERLGDQQRGRAGDVDRVASVVGGVQR